MNVGSHEFFSFFPREFTPVNQSIFAILYIARCTNRENPNIRKNPKVLRGKAYLSSLLLSKTRKYNVANKTKIKIEKSTDQIQVKCVNCKKSAYYEKVMQKTLLSII